MSTGVENLRLLKRLQRAINALPTLTAPIVVEDEWGQRYDLINVYTVGRRAADTGLVLKIRMHAQHPDADRGVIR